MAKAPSNMVFMSVLYITGICGVVMVFVALVPLFFIGGVTSPFLEPLFNTLSYLFSTGVGAVFGMLGSYSVQQS